MTRILHASPTYYDAASVVGGGEKYVVYMARAMNREISGVENDLLAFGPQPGRYQISQDIHCQVILGEAWNQRSIDAAALRRILIEYDIIVVHQALCPVGLFIAAHAKALRKRVYGLDEGGGEHPITRHTPEVGRIFDGFIAYSVFCASSFADLDAPTYLALGPVDTDWYTPTEDERRIDVVLAVGRLLPHKGIDRIISVLPEGLMLRAIGSRYDEQYFAHLTSLGAGKNVEFVEGLSDEQVRDEYRRAGLMVHASTHYDYLGRHYTKPELLGLAPLEALACGARVLVSNAGALPELANIPGCDVFNSDEHLSTLLQQYRDGLLPSPPATEIAAATANAYGPQAFCRAVSEIMGL